MPRPVKSCASSIRSETPKPAPSAAYHLRNGFHKSGSSTPSGMKSAMLSSTLSQICSVKRWYASRQARKSCKLHCRAANSFGSLRSSVTKTVITAQPTSSTAQTAFPHGKRRPFLRQTA